MGRVMRRLVVVVVAVLGVALLGAPAQADVLPLPTLPAPVSGLLSPTPGALGGAAGAVLHATDLPTNLWIPGTKHAWRLTYVSTDAFGHQVPVNGTVFIPQGPTPAGGWPVITWAHGTSGLNNACAPSLVGPAEPARDFPYLATWMAQGYAIVATDYAGFGTSELPAYLHGLSEAHNVVDMVLAGRSFINDQGVSHLAAKYFILGQSQGGGAAIYTARYATQFGPGLDYRGAVGTGTPANIEKAVLLLAPGVPPANIPGQLDGIKSYMAYILASLRYVHPELGIDSALTAEGEKYVGLAEQQCVNQFEQTVDATNLGNWFKSPLALLPNFEQTVEQYMAMPTSGFDKPFFMANGLIDTDVPLAVVLPYVLQLEANLQPVQWHTYPTDHNGTMQASLVDSIPFVKRIMS